MNRNASHRKALMANLATSILDKERITTTVAKAKEVRRLVERLITYGKRGGLHAVRIAGRFVKDEDILRKLFKDIAPSFADRKGGYTRVIKLGRRQGDNADLAIIELVGRRGEEQRKKPKRKRRTSARRQAEDRKVTGTPRQAQEGGAGALQREAVPADAGGGTEAAAAAQAEEIKPANQEDAQK